MKPTIWKVILIRTISPSVENHTPLGFERGRLAPTLPGNSISTEKLEFVGPGANLFTITSSSGKS